MLENEASVDARDQPPMKRKTGELLPFRARGFDVTAPSHALQLGDRCCRIAYVLEKMRADHIVESLVREREALDISNDQRTIADKNVPVSFCAVRNELVAQDVGSGIWASTAPHVEDQVISTDLHPTLDEDEISEGVRDPARSQERVHSQ